MSIPFHSRYLSLVSEIERAFPVTAWKSGDVEIWPLARMDLYLDMYWQSAGGKPADAIPRAARALAHAMRPLTNIWARRNDLRHYLGWPKPAHAIFLGDGVSLDCVDGAWQDRYCEPLIAELEKQGRSSFLTQSGDMRRTPWHRPTFAANIVETAGQALALFSRERATLPELSELLQFLSANGVDAPSLSANRLARRARIVSATACAFEQILKAVKPELAFVVTYYAGLGPAFLLACRRQGILSVDLQHCPQTGHKAYHWSALPGTGYATLPSIFWNWTAEDAAVIEAWTVSSPWHRGLHGGHPRLAAFLNDEDPQTRRWDDIFSKLSGGFEREILVALQTTHGHDDLGNALADQIEAAPLNWRWWIRRHPAWSAEHETRFSRLLSLSKPNVVIEEASSLPLPALLRHMSVVLSLASGTAAEAAFFGVPAIFLSSDANAQFGGLIASRRAAIVEDISTLNAKIANLPRISPRPLHLSQPDLAQTLATLSGMANEYKKLCKPA